MSRKEIDEFGSEVRVLVLYSKYSQHSYDAILTRLMGVQANNLYCGKDDKHSLKLSHSCRALVVYWKRLLSLGSRCFEDAFYKILFFFFFLFLSGDCIVGYEKSCGVSLLLDLGEHYFN